MSLEEGEIKKGSLEEGVSEVGLLAKRQKSAVPGASLSIFSFYSHNNHPMTSIAMIDCTHLTDEDIEARSG